VPSEQISGMMTTSVPERSDQVTVFHVTHWKAGSQWIRKILTDCAPERIIPAEEDGSQFLKRPLVPGRIYTPVYASRDQFNSVHKPPNWRRLVVIRDLRDTLVSVYFSVKFSHPMLSDELRAMRAKLESLELRQGLIWLMDEWLHHCATIQHSWLESGERLLHFEDLNENDLELLEPILADELRVPLPRPRIRQVILNNRFEKVTGGRPRGLEDVSSHYRKGIAGDWRHYFTEDAKEQFKARFGDLLIATGYEKDLSW
jgi:lipopolysaccharide transport system ATP-binding protein